MSLNFYGLAGFVGFEVFEAATMPSAGCRLRSSLIISASLDSLSDHPNLMGAEATAWKL